MYTITGYVRCMYVRIYVHTYGVSHANGCNSYHSVIIVPVPHSNYVESVSHGCNESGPLTEV